VFSRGVTPTTRPEVLQLPPDVDNDEGTYRTGDDHIQTDSTTPDFPNDFIMDVLSTTADSATIRIRYGLEDRPDPSIMPWSALTNWQSPDLEVINERSMADPFFRNIPWEGHDNIIQAHVTNRGASPAAGVTVRFSTKDFTFAGGEETALGAQTQDLAPNGQMTFKAPTRWRPPLLSLPSLFGNLTFPQHACVVARIDKYVTPTIRETTPDNNEAQSNYTWTATTTASPARRTATVLRASNPYNVPATVFFEFHQPSPLFRTYLQHRWLHLQPGEERQLLVMTETVLGDPKLEGLVRQHINPDQRLFTHLRLSALGHTGAACAPEVLGRRHHSRRRRPRSAL
jgi:hypothetical protein